MDDVHRARMDRALDKLRESDIDDLTREQMQDALAKAARAANGSPDKVAAMADCLESLTVGLVHFIAAAPGYAAKAATIAVAGHAADCARMMREASALPPAPTGAAAAARRWVEALRPVAWPLATAVGIIGASGSLPEVIDAIRRLVAG